MKRGVYTNSRHGMRLGSWRRWPAVMRSHLPKADRALRWSDERMRKFNGEQSFLRAQTHENDCTAASSTRHSSASPSRAATRPRARASTVRNRTARSSTLVSILMGSRVATTAGVVTGAAQPDSRQPTATDSIQRWRAGTSRYRRMECRRRRCASRMATAAGRRGRPTEA